MATTLSNINNEIKKIAETVEYDASFLSRIPEGNQCFSNRNKQAISQDAVFSRIQFACIPLQQCLKSLSFIQTPYDEQDKTERLSEIQEKAKAFLRCLNDFEHNPCEDSFNLLKDHFNEFHNKVKISLSIQPEFLPDTLIQVLYNTITKPLSFKHIIEDLDKIFFPEPLYKRLRSATYSQVKSLNHAQFRKQLMESEYRNNQIIAMCQSEHPIIQDAGGYCYGLTVLGVYQILTFHRFFTYDLNAPHQHFSKKMNFLNGNFPSVERCQNARLFPEHNDNLITICKFDATLQTTSMTSNLVADNVYSVFNRLKKENFAVLLTMRGAAGHDIGIVVKDSQYYLIDSDTGLFKFNALNELRDFTYFLMKHYKYSHLCNDYTVENIPQLENRFPLPKVLKEEADRLVKEKPATVQKSNCNARTLTFMRDKFYELYYGSAIIQTAVTNKTKEVQGCITNAYNAGKALGSILR